MEQYQITPENIPPDLMPDEKITLWRYMPFSSLCDILMNDCIPLISVRNFPDKSEGVILRKILSKLPDVNVDQIEYAMQKYRESVYISSWHISKNENAAMWDRYTHGGEGIAIKTNAKLLLDCIPHQSIISGNEGGPIMPKLSEPKEGIIQPRMVIIKPIKYIDNSPSDYEMDKKDFNNGYDKMCYFYKFVDFQDEAEVRILTSTFLDQYGYAWMNPKNFFKHSTDDPISFENSLTINIGSANTLIEQIVISPDAHSNFIYTVIQMIDLINKFRESSQSDRIQCDIDESRRKAWV